MFIFHMRHEHTHDHGKAMKRQIDAEALKNRELQLKIKELELQLLSQASPKTPEVPAPPVDNSSAKVSALIEQAMTRMHRMEEMLKQHEPTPPEPKGDLNQEQGVRALSKSAQAGDCMMGEGGEGDETDDDEESVITTPSGHSVPLTASVHASIYIVFQCSVCTKLH